MKNVNRNIQGETSIPKPNPKALPYIHGIPSWHKRDSHPPSLGKEDSSSTPAFNILHVAQAAARCPVQARRKSKAQQKGGRGSRSTASLGNPHQSSSSWAPRAGTEPVREGCPLCAGLLREEPGRNPIYQGRPDSTSRSCVLSPSSSRNRGEHPTSFVRSPAKTLAHPPGQLTISVYSPRGPSPRIEPRNPAVNPGCQSPQATFIHPCARHCAKCAQDSPESQGCP